LNWLQEHPQGVTLLLHVQPRAPASAIAGFYDGRLKLKIKAAPVEGQANDEIIRFFAKLLKVKQNQIAIMSGDTGKQKRILITGITFEVATEKINSKLT
jgi:uncharacterized protein (TIGR00251 family)